MTTPSLEVQPQSQDPELQSSTTSVIASARSSTTTNSRDKDKEAIEDATCQLEAGLKLDSHGLPLVPQPSHFKDDPLNWPSWLKWTVLIQVGFMAFLGPFNAGLINPSLMLLSRATMVDFQIATYSTTTGIIAGGLSPFIFAPLANYYGRRPVTLVAMLLTIIGGSLTPLSPNFPTLVGMRAVCGFGFGGMMSVGTATVNDMFYLHERGEKTGVYSIFITNGAHVAALVGGFLGQSAGWKWDYYLGAISTFTSFLVALFFFPETLFSRDPEFLKKRLQTRTYIQMLFAFRGNMILERQLHASDFIQSFRMLKYPSVLIPFWYYTWAWTFINVLPAISLAKIYTHFYHLESGPIGACLGGSLIIGSLLGEVFAGKASDWIMYQMARRNNNIRKPEYRLYLLVLSAIFMPAGLTTFGGCLGHTGFIAPLVGLSIGGFGLQITNTCLYAYISDCYRPQTPESGVLFNLSRGLSFVVGYFALPLADAVGYFWAWFIFGASLCLCFVPIILLMIYGERWRDKLGEPDIHRYL